MNDSEIIKALKHLRTSTLNGWREKKITEKDLNTISYALDLIKRQQAEIDRLNIEINIETVKSEAVREFAEKLKPMLSFGRYTSYEQIDNLVKEMGCNDG